MTAAQRLIAEALAAHGADIRREKGLPPADDQDEDSGAGNAASGGGAAADGGAEAAADAASSSKKRSHSEVAAASSSAPKSRRTVGRSVGWSVAVCATADSGSAGSFPSPTGARLTCFPSLSSSGAAQIEFELRKVNPHIVCKLCAGYFINATTIMECLHTCWSRFQCGFGGRGLIFWAHIALPAVCRSCIVKYFRHNKTCPTCSIVVHGTNPYEMLRLGAGTDWAGVGGWVGGLCDHRAVRWT